MAKKEKEIQLTFTSSELEALKQLVGFALDADIVREPFPDPVKGALQKLELSKAKREAVSFAAAAPERLPVRSE